MEPYVDKVIRCADENRDSFGFLPHPSYLEAAARGRLWIATDGSGSLLAYLFFGGRFPNISITQLFVAGSARGTGVGRRLIEDLKAYAIQKRMQTVSARVAADLEANLFWEKCDFLLMRQVPGGLTKSRMINERVYEVSDSSSWHLGAKSSAIPQDVFLDRPASVVPSYVLDLNVFFDVIKNRVEAESGRRLVAAALANRLSIRVTSEFVKELEKHSYDIKNDPVLSFAKEIPALPVVPAEIVRKLSSELRPLVFPDANRSTSRRENDESDLVHLAICVHHRSSAFVTREKATLRAADALEKRYQLEVVSPSDILPEEDDHTFDFLPIHASLSGHAFRLQAFSEVNSTTVEEFLKWTIGATGEQLRGALDPETEQIPNVRWVGMLDDQPIGFFSYRLETFRKPKLDGFFAVNEASEVAQQFVDHILQKIHLEQPWHVPCVISLATLPNQQLVINTARGRSYAIEINTNPIAVAWLKRVGYREVITSKNWGEFARKLQREFQKTLPHRIPTFSEAINTGIAVVSAGHTDQRPRRLADFESFFAPLLLALPGRLGSIVPIFEGYANELLQLSNAQIPLLPGKEAQLRIERAYFGKPGFEKAFTRDGLVVFYVSGKAKGRKQAVGIARVTYAAKVPIAKASTEFLRYGVLEQEVLKSLANKRDEVGVFTFDSFVPFSSPVSYSDLQGMQ